MAVRSAEVVICGAGLAGVAAAYHLAVRRGVGGVVLVDSREPLSLSSRLGGAGYHTLWADSDRALGALLERGIDGLEAFAEESQNVFGLDRRGCVLVSAQPEGGHRLRRLSDVLGCDGSGKGCDLLLDPEEIHRRFPFLSHDAQGVLYLRRAGWFDAERLGGWWLERARAHGVEVVRDRLDEVGVRGGRVEKVVLRSGAAISAKRVVIAAGAGIARVLGPLGLDLPLETELGGQMLFRERLGIVPSGSPLLIWDDPFYLRWNHDERRQLATGGDTRALLGEMPGGVWVRPYDNESGGCLLVSWPRLRQKRSPERPPSFEPFYGEVLLRALVRVVPGLFVYFGHGGEGHLEGGYTVRAPDGRPLIGELPIEGAYLLGALADYGAVAAPAAGELLAELITGGKPSLEPGPFAPGRYL